MLLLPQCFSQGTYGHNKPLGPVRQPEVPEIFACALALRRHTGRMQTLEKKGISSVFFSHVGCDHIVENLN